MAYTAETYGGLALTCMELEQGISYLRLFLSHSNAKTLVGKLITI